MKNYLPVIGIYLLFFSCSQKTRIAELSKIEKHINAVSDSIGKRFFLSQDKSITTTTIDVDTAINLSSTPLKGIIHSGELAKHYENNDLSIDFKQDQSSGSIDFTATPKNKTINARYHKKIVVQNDIAKSGKSQSLIKKQSASDQDSTYNKITEHRDPLSTISGIKSTIIWGVILLALIMAAYFIWKKKLI